MLITLRVNIESVLFNTIACVADVIKHRVVHLRSSAYVLVDCPHNGLNEYRKEG